MLAARVGQPIRSAAREDRDQSTDSARASGASAYVRVMARTPSSHAAPAPGSATRHSASATTNAIDARRAILRRGEQRRTGCPLPTMHNSLLRQKPQWRTRLRSRCVTRSKWHKFTKHCQLPCPCQIAAHNDVRKLDRAVAAMLTLVNATSVHAGQETLER